MAIKIKWNEREWNAFKDGALGLAGLAVFGIALSLLVTSVFCFVYFPKTSIGVIAFAVIAAALFAPRRGQ